MNTNLKLDPTKLLIFHELKKRRIYVGELIYDVKLNVYKLLYDRQYANSKSAIPLDLDLTLDKLIHVSKKGQLFAALLDRIPERANPAYADYCHAQNISVAEQNPIILLGSIGRKGPSTFVFEAVYKDNFSIADIIKLRRELNITQHDLAKAFSIKNVTLQRMESGISNDENTIKLLQIYFNFPQVALWQLLQTGGNIHSTVLAMLIKYFTAKLHTNKNKT